MGGADAGLCVCVCVCASGKPAAPGQHRVQRPGPEGAAAARQGMNQITPLFVSAARQPACLPRAAPALAFAQSHSPGIPVLSTQRMFLPWPKGCVFWSRSL